LARASVDSSRGGTWINDYWRSAGLVRVGRLLLGFVVTVAVVLVR